jgi:uncharacterized membrane protein YgcG/mono/diheme cytochrome c family protein
VRSHPTVRSTRGPLAAAALASTLLAACGTGGAAKSSAPAVTGVALAEAPLANASVALTDASSPAQQHRASTRADGSFSVDVAGLVPPFLVQVEPGAPGARTLYAVAEASGDVDVTPFSDLAVAYAAGATRQQDLFQSAAPDQRRAAAVSARAVLADLAQAAAPLLADYGIGSLRSDQGAVRRLLQDVTVQLSEGIVIIRNRGSGAVIVAAPLANPGRGSVDPVQLPGRHSGVSSGGASSGASSDGTFPGGSSSGGGASGGAPAGSSSSGAVIARPADVPTTHPAIPMGASCTSCHVAGSSGGGGPAGSSGGSPGASSSGGPAASSSSGGPPASSSSSGGPSDAGGIDGCAVYVSRCASCHGALGQSAVQTTTGARILASHPDLVTSAEADAVATGLAITKCEPGVDSGGGGFWNGISWSYSCPGTGDAGGSPSPGSSGGISGPGSSSGAFPGSSGSSSGSFTGSSSGASSSGASGSGTAGPDGYVLYVAQCASCHGPLGQSNVQSATAARILARHADLVSAQQASGIATALLETTCPPGSGGGGSSASGVYWSCPATADGGTGSGSSGGSSSGAGGP